jgi:hypothetical protein
MGVLILYFICLFLTTLFIISFHLIENFLDEGHPLMKWWRKHIVGINPYPDDSDE